MYEHPARPVCWQRLETQRVQMERLGSWFKQRDNNWLTAWAYVYCTTLLRLPFSLVDAAMWSVVVYFVTGLAPDAARSPSSLPPASVSPCYGAYITWQNGGQSAGSCDPALGRQLISWEYSCAHTHIQGLPKYSVWW